MKTIEIFDEENSIIIDDDFSTDTIDFFPDIKNFKLSSSIKDDCFYNYATYEYKISTNPIEVYVRLLERSSEPPKEYAVRDGVVLESEIIKGKDGYILKITEERILSLKKEIQWNKVELANWYAVFSFILFKHSEIVSKEDFRKFLRQSAERIKLGVLKIEEAVKGDTHGLEIYTSESGKNVWYQPPNKLEEKEIDEYWKLPKEKKLESKYGKKFEYAENFNELLFKKDSPKYVGISKYEFETSSEILKHIDYLLNKKEDKIIKKKVEDEKKLKTKGIIVSFFLTLFISWVLSWFVDVNPFLIFILVQLIAFFQSIIGRWIGKFFE